MDCADIVAVVLSSFQVSVKLAPGQLNNCYPGTQQAKDGRLLSSSRTQQQHVFPLDICEIDSGKISALP